MKQIFIAALKEETPNLDKFHHSGVGKINASIMSDSSPESISLNEAIDLINARKVKMGIKKSKISKPKRILKKQPPISEKKYSPSGIATKKESASYTRYIKEPLGTREDFKKDKKRTFGDVANNRIIDKIKKK